MIYIKNRTMTVIESIRPGLGRFSFPPGQPIELVDIVRDGVVVVSASDLAASIVRDQGHNDLYILSDDDADAVQPKEKAPKDSEETAKRIKEILSAK